MDIDRMFDDMSYLLSRQRMENPTLDLYTQMANRMDYLDSVERIYPEAYRRMLPYVSRVLNEVDDPAALTVSTLGKISRDVVLRSGILGDPPRGHNEMTLRDLAGIMLLATLVGRGDTRRHPWTMPLPHGRRRRGNIIY